MGKQSIDSSAERIRNSRVFILGAGFSKKAGIPMTGDLLNLTMQKMQKECPGLFERITNHVVTCFSLDSEKKPDYSKIEFSQLCTFLEYIELSEYAGGERWSNAGSREKLVLKYYLAKTIVELTPNQGSIPDLYLEFAEQLNYSDIVISFNWDTLLEAALEEIGKQYSYNFETNRLKLCKLHGSINWRINVPQHSKTLSWNPLGFGRGIMDHEIYTADELLDSRTWYHYNPLGEVEPFLVLPGYGKAFDVRFISTLWYRPEFAFSATHDVYIIGLSLSKDDFFIRNFFLDNLPFIDSCSGVSGRKIVIINPGPEIKNNYKFILETDLAQLFPEPFSLKHVQMIKKQ